jgi:uncharacterized protein (DUF736 family)
MSTIAILKRQMNGTAEELVGEIRTLQFSLKVRFVQVLNKKSEKSPDYRIYSGVWDDRAVQIGTAWKKQKTRPDGTVFEFLTITIDDPSLPQALNVAAFLNEDGDWEITFRRRQPKSNAA